MQEIHIKLRSSIMDEPSFDARGIAKLLTNLFLIPQACSGAFDSRLAVNSKSSCPGHLQIAGKSAVVFCNLSRHK